MEKSAAGKLTQQLGGGFVVSAASPMLKLLPLLLALAWPAPFASAVEIIAHRGASHDAPENTLAAYRLAWEQGADAGELDIYLTKDGQIVLLHDKTARRTTGVDRPIAEMTLAEVNALDAGTWKGAAWAGERAPTLAGVLAELPAGKRLFIEIKCGAEVLPELGRVMQASGKKAEQLVLIGFDFETMRQAREWWPKAPIYWLASYKADKATGELPKIEDLIAKARAAKFDGLNLEQKFPIDAAFVARVKAAGLELFTWTVNDAAVGRRLAAAGLDGITTDRPAWLREQLSAR